MSRASAQPRDRIARALRASVCALVLAGMATWFVAERAHAYGERVLRHFGDHMMRFAGADNQMTPVELRLNGARLYLSNGAVDAPVGAVLDAFHAKCAARNGQLAAAWRDVAAQAGRAAPRRGALLDGVFRAGDEQQGLVACFETGDERLAPASMVERARAALASGDLSKFGGLRYVRVFRGKERSVFVAVWTEGALEIGRMFPARGDAPGQDPPGVPRLAGTRRVLSSGQTGRAESLTMYVAEQRTAKDLAAAYRSALVAAGFTLPADENARMFVAHAGRQMVTITLGDDARTGHGVATIATHPN